MSGGGGGYKQGEDDESFRVYAKRCSDVIWYCGPRGVSHMSIGPHLLGFLGVFRLKKRTEVLIKLLSSPIRSSRWYSEQKFKFLHWS